MTWNHRVIKLTYDEETLYGIYEVFYNKDGTVMAYTENPVVAEDESLEDLEQTLKWMRKALRKPVLEYGKITKEELDTESEE